MVKNVVWSPAGSFQNNPKIDLSRNLFPSVSMAIWPRLPPSANDGPWVTQIGHGHLGMHVIDIPKTLATEGIWWKDKDIQKNTNSFLVEPSKGMYQ